MSLRLAIDYEFFIDSGADIGVQNFNKTCAFLENNTSPLAGD